MKRIPEALNHRFIKTSPFVCTLCNALYPLPFFTFQPRIFEYCERQELWKQLPPIARHFIDRSATPPCGDGPSGPSKKLVRAIVFSPNSAQRDGVIATSVPANPSSVKSRVISVVRPSLNTSDLVRSSRTERPEIVAPPDAWNELCSTCAHNAQLRNRQRRKDEDTKDVLGDVRFGCAPTDLRNTSERSVGAKPFRTVQ